MIAWKYINGFKIIRLKENEKQRNVNGKFYELVCIDLSRQNPFTSVMTQAIQGLFLCEYDIISIEAGGISDAFSFRTMFLWSHIKTSYFFQLRNFPKVKLPWMLVLGKYVCDKGARNEMMR
jgi:hypothetical protein